MSDDLIGKTDDMDDTDRKLLNALAQNARQSVALLAKELGLARSTVQTRLDRLEASGVIAGYTIRLGDTARTRRIFATVLLQVEPRTQPQVLARLRSMPAVERVHTTSGRFDLTVKIGAATTDELDQHLDTLGGIPGLKSTETLIHLATKIDRAP